MDVAINRQASGKDEVSLEPRQTPRIDRRIDIVVDLHSGVLCGELSTRVQLASKPEFSDHLMECRGQYFDGKLFWNERCQRPRRPARTPGRIRYGAVVASEAIPTANPIPVVPSG